MSIAEDLLQVEWPTELLSAGHPLSSRPGGLVYISFPPDTPIWKNKNPHKANKLAGQVALYVCFFCRPCWKEILDTLVEAELDEENHALTRRRLIDGVSSATTPLSGALLHSIIRASVALASESRASQGGDSTEGQQQPSAAAATTTCASW